MPQLGSFQIRRSRSGVFLLTHLTIHVPSLPKEWMGLKMVQLTDFHYGPATSAQHLRSATERVNELKPDMILLTGDYVHYSISGFQHTISSRFNPPQLRWHDYRRRTRKLIQEFSDIVAELQAPLGIYATLGNHDHIEGAGSLIRLLPENIQWLTNNAAILERGGSSLFIAGVDDVNRGKPNLEDALLVKSGSRDHFFRLLLSHNPDITLDRRADLLSSIDLLLCGHTHGGQIRLPFLGALATRTKQKLHTVGLSQHEQTLVYTNQGVGYGLLPLRVLCPPEILIIELLPPEKI